MGASHCELSSTRLADVGSLGPGTIHSSLKAAQWHVRGGRSFFAPTLSMPVAEALGWLAIANYQVHGWPRLVP